MTASKPRPIPRDPRTPRARAEDELECCRIELKLNRRDNVVGPKYLDQWHDRVDKALTAWQASLKDSS